MAIKYQNTNTLITNPLAFFHVRRTIPLPIHHIIPAPLLVPVASPVIPSQPLSEARRESHRRELGFSESTVDARSKRLAYDPQLLMLG